MFRDLPKNQGPVKWKENIGKQVPPKNHDPKKRADTNKLELGLENNLDLLVDLYRHAVDQ